MSALPTVTVRFDGAVESSWELAGRPASSPMSAKVSVVGERIWGNIGSTVLIQ